MSQSTAAAKRSGRLLLKSAEIGRDERIEPTSEIAVDAVKNPLRYEILLYVFGADASVSRDALATHLADWHLEADDGPVSDEEHERMRILLHHEHLPQLAGSGLIEYDQRDETVGLTDYAEKPLAVC